MIKFDGKFKIGISKNTKRPFTLATTKYSDYYPQLSESYLLYYHDRSTLLNIETKIKNQFSAYRVQFETEKPEGHTEFFYTDCLSDIIEDLNYHLTVNNLSTDDIAKKMTLVKGIPRPGNRYVLIDQATTILNVLESNVDNLVVDIKQKAYDYFVTIQFCTPLKAIPSPAKYTYNDRRESSLGVYGVRDAVVAFDLNHIEIKIRIYPACPSSLIHKKTRDFFTDVLTILNLQSFWEKIRIDYETIQAQEFSGYRADYLCQ